MNSGVIHIGLDMDGVLIDHAAQKQTLARTAGYTLSLKQTGSAHLVKLMPNPEYRLLQAKLYDDPDISLRSPLMPGVHELLSGFRRRNVRYTLVSRRRRPDWAAHILRHHKLWPDFFTEENAFFVTRPEEKNHVALRVGITHYLDDEVKILRILEDVPHKFLMDPYGMYAPTAWYAVMRSLPEFLRLIAS
ncbi:MAG TPA: hypothetical protein VD862_00840 [Candidatus Paceibacterota bacterium]|nr:hypothetical protein [Candidatus Paceibacterota bacterium]